MLVRDLMKADPITIRGEETCYEAAFRMSRHKIRHLPVVDRRGLLEGMLTDRDLRHHLLSAGVASELGRRPVKALLGTARVVDVMSNPAIVATPDEELTDAVARMRKHRIGSLPIVEGRMLLGILTETDLVRRIAEADAESEIEVTEVVVSSQ